MTISAYHAVHIPPMSNSKTFLALHWSMTFTSTWETIHGLHSICSRHSVSNFLSHPTAAAAESLQSCPTLWDPIDGSPPGSSIHGIFQARVLEWGAIAFSNAWKWKVKVKLLSRVRLLVTHGLQPTRLLHQWDFPGKSTGVGCHCLLHFILLVPCNSLDNIGWL